MSRALRLAAAAVLALSLGVIPLDAVASTDAAVPAGPTYKRLDRVIVPVIRDGAVKGHLTFVLVLELHDSEAVKRFEELQPRLVDAFMRELHVYASRTDLAEGIDVKQVKRRLVASGARVLGPDALQDVLIERTATRRFE